MLVRLGCLQARLFLPVRVLSSLFRRFAALNQAGRLAVFGELAPLADKRAFDAAHAPLRRPWITIDT